MQIGVQWYGFVPPSNNQKNESVVITTIERKRERVREREIYRVLFRFCIHRMLSHLNERIYSFFEFLVCRKIRVQPNDSALFHDQFCICAYDRPDNIPSIKTFQVQTHSESVPVHARFFSQFKAFRSFKFANSFPFKSGLKTIFKGFDQIIEEIYKKKMATNFIKKYAYQYRLNDLKL